MLDISFIRAHGQVIKNTCQKRGLQIDVQKVIDLDSGRKRLFFLINDDRNKLKNLEENRKYYEEDQFVKEKQSLISDLKNNKNNYKETLVDLKKNMLLLPNIIDMQAPMGKSIVDASLLKIVGKDFENKNIINENKDLRHIKAIEFFKEKSFMDFGKVKFISDKNEFLMHPVASKIYISS